MKRFLVVLTVFGGVVLLAWLALRRAAKDFEPVDVDVRTGPIDAAEKVA